MDEVKMISSEKRGYNVYVDGVYIGTEGTNGDAPDGNFTVYVPGNSQHSITADDGKFTYGLRNFPFGDGMPYLFSLDDPQMKQGPSFHPENSGEILNDKSETSAQFSSKVQNQPPNILSLNPDLQSPQQVGVFINWRATATDPENDPIYYRFSLSGPRTGGQWQVVQDWSQNNAWSWKVEDRDAGNSNIQVEIKGEKRGSFSDIDAFKEYDNYQIIQSQLTTLNAEVTNDVYSEKDRVVYYCQEGKDFYVKNRIYLTGPDLSKVKSVKYVLHPTFPNPEQISEDSSNSFEIWIWTWGRLPVKAIITTNTGQQFEKDHAFSFKSKYEEAQRKGIPQVRNCDD